MYALTLLFKGPRLFRWNERTGKWTNLNEVHCRIPRDTVLEAEVVSELKGEVGWLMNYWSDTCANENFGAKSEGVLLHNRITKGHLNEGLHL